MGSSDPVCQATAVLEALPRGAALLQLRAKHHPAARQLDWALALREVTRSRGVALLVNDRMDVALAAKADGVHLPESGLPVANVRALGAGLVGVSVHDRAGIAAAQAAGADFVTLAPVYATPGKGAALGLDELAKACTQFTIPIYALGGIGPTNARRCREAGAYGVAAIRSVFASGSPGTAARALYRAVE